MNYQNIYLLSIIGTGLVFSILSLPILVSDPSLSSIFGAIGGVGMVIAGGYDLFLADTPSAPTEPNGLVIFAVLGFVLSVAGVTITAVT